MRVRILLGVPTKVNNMFVRNKMLVQEPNSHNNKKRINRFNEIQNESSLSKRKKLLINYFKSYENINWNFNGKIIRVGDVFSSDILNHQKYFALHCIYGNVPGHPYVVCLIGCKNDIHCISLNYIYPLKNNDSCGCSFLENQCCPLFGEKRCK